MTQKLQKKITCKYFYIITYTQYYAQIAELKIRPKSIWSCIWKLWNLGNIDITRYIQAFLDFRGFDFCNFWINAGYNSIPFSSSLILLSTSIYTVFAFRGFSMCPHINSVNLEMSVHILSIILETYQVQEWFGYRV